MDAREQAEAGLLAQEIVYAGMEALRAAMPLDLCAYLHASEDGGPQLFLATPDLSSIDATEAFTLFNALRDALDADHDGDESVLLGGYMALTVTTQGPRSRGLHVVGRREAPLDPAERAAATRVIRSIGAVVHSLEGRPEPRRPGATGAPVRVAVETIDGRARAEVTAPFGDEVRTGVAEESTPARAVAAAVIDAVDASMKLVDTAEGEIGGERAVLVVLADHLGLRALGSSLIDDRIDPLQATAISALDAATRLSAKT